MSSKQIHIIEAIRQLEHWFMNRTCQLFHIVDHGKVEAEASAFFLEINGLKMVVTAGHVLKEGRFNHLCFPNLKSSGMTSFEGTWYPSDKNDNVGDDNDDFAYLLLEDETCNILQKNGYEFIKDENIDFSHIASPKNIYTAIGCRWRKTKKVGVDHYSKLEIMTNKGAQEYMYEKEINDFSQVLMLNNRKMKNPDTGNLEKTGRLEGMSGGSLWHTDLTHNYYKSNPSVKLVGILQSYDNNCIVSTNIRRLQVKLLERNHLK